MAGKVDGTVNALLKGMEGFISSKTIIGDPIVVKDMVIIPVADVTFGAGAGAFGSEEKDNCGGGIGGKVSPSGLLIIQNGTSKLVTLKDTDVITKLVDIVPDLINKFTGKNKEESSVELDIDNE